MKEYIFFIIFIICTNSVYAQVPIDESAKNEMKYWKLRGRLIGDDNNKDVYNGFMTVGSGDGMSIPAATRAPLSLRNSYDFDPNQPGSGCSEQTINGTSTHTTYDANGNPTILVPNPPGPPVSTGNPLIDARDGKELKGVLKFSDNSLIEIGNYLGVLATEWALLHRANMSTVQTEKEIYYALLAVQRLDLKGESIYGLSANQNGFLMRGDIDAEFQLNTTGSNIDMVTSAIACESFTSPCSESNAVVTSPNAMSQDEVIGLMLGFSLMKKMMPDYASYNGVALRPWSRDLAEKIIKYVKKGGTTNFWTIVDPDLEKRVCRGSKAISSSYPLAAIGEYIFGYNTLFQNGWSLSLGKLMWKLRKDYIALNNYDVHLFFGMPTGMQTALNLNSYEPIVVPGVTNGSFNHDGAHNVSMMLKLLACSKTAQRVLPPYNDYTGKQLINTVSQTYLKNMYELLGSVIYGYKPIQSEYYWRNEFNQMTCDCNCIQGISNPTYNGCDKYYSLVPPNIPANNYSFPSIPWSVEDRWAFTGKYGGSYPSDPNNIYSPGTLEEYNGLDYMLAYNLYKWKYFDGGYTDKVRKHVYNLSFPWNFPGSPVAGPFTLGGDQYPLEVKAVFSVESDNTTLEQDAHVYFFGGSDIKLKPGFHAKPGSVFAAKIQEYDCNPVQYTINGMDLVSYKTEDTLTQTSYLDDDDTISNIQLDGDSVNVYDEGPDIDSFYVLTYTNNTDTFYYDLHPDYVYDDSGNIVYAPAFNRQALQEASANSIILYPNPTSTKAFVEYTLYYESEVKLEVTNELGQIMTDVLEQQIFKQQKGKQKITLNTSNLNSGIYFCMVELNGRREVLKFTVLK